VEKRKDEMTEYKFVVIKGKEDYEEFECEDLKFYVFNGALWIACLHSFEDVKVRELHELDSVAEGTQVTIELSKELLKACRNERAIEDLDYLMGIYELYKYSGSGLTPEEFFERYYKDAMKQIRMNLIKWWFGIEGNSLSSFNISAIAERLAQYLLEFDEQNYPPEDKE